MLLVLWKRFWRKRNTERLSKRKRSIILNLNSILSLELGKNGRSPGIGGFLSGGKVFGDDAVLGNQRKALGSWHHGGVHGETEGSCEFAIAITEELDVGIGSARSSSPGFHNKEIIGSDADDHIDSLLGELILCSDKTREVALRAPWGEGTRNSKDDNLLSSNEFGNVDIVLSAKIRKTFLEDHGGDFVSGLDFFDGGHGLFRSREQAAGGGFLLKAQETVSKREGSKQDAKSKDGLHGGESVSSRILWSSVPSNMHAHHEKRFSFAKIVNCVIDVQEMTHCSVVGKGVSQLVSHVCRRF